MRKLLSALAVMFLMATVVVAADVTVLSYDKDKNEVKVKTDKDEVKTLKVSDKVKVTLVDAEGKESEGKAEDLTRRLGFAAKASESGKAMKLDVTVEGGAITAVKLKSRGKKNN
jgi:hypothetical protein